MKKKYDTAVVFLYATGRESLLPEAFRKSIPYSTIATWRKTDYSKYEGHQFRYYFDDALDKAGLVNRYHNLKKMVNGIARTWFLLSPPVSFICFSLFIVSLRRERDSNPFPIP